MRLKEVIIVLSRLLGKKYNCVSRAVDMLCLFLGEDYTITDHRGKQIVVAEYSIHLQTQWRFRENGTILLASRDIYESYSENVPEDWQYDLIGRSDELSSVFDVRSEMLKNKMQGAVVTECRLSSVNDMTIIFSNGVIFEQFTPASRKDEEWRFIDYKKDEHIVCYDEEDRISIV
jgi:hypothetical protein